MTVLSTQFLIALPSRMNFLKSSGFSSVPNNTNQPRAQPQYNQSTYGAATYQPQMPPQPEKSTNEKIKEAFDNFGNKIVEVFTPTSNEPAQVTSVSLLDEAPQPTSKAPVVQKQKTTKKFVHLTPAKKFIKTTSGNAKPTQAEENTFVNNMVETSIDELIEALNDQDWKVKARACRGLELCAEHFGFEKIHPAKSTIQGLVSAPQKSLQLASKSLLDKMASAPTGFSFAQTSAQPATESAPVSDEVINFGEEQ